MLRLVTNFGGKKDLEAKNDLYYDKLKRFPLAIVEAAVERTIDAGGEYFPKVHKVVNHAKEVERERAGVDDSPRAQMRAWETDPFEGVVYDTPEKLAACPSRPCPVCEAVLIMSPRGYVIRHDDAKHTEAQVSYCNVGRVEWFEMGPPVMPGPKKRDQVPKPAPPPAPISVGDVAGQVLVNTLPKGALPPGTIPPVEEESDGGV